MDPVTIALICAAAFGTVVALAAFIRQLVISRDKKLNDVAQRKALAQETGELEKMRKEMQSSKRFDSHYRVLGANKDAIIYLDSKIEDILQKKTLLIDRYAQVSIKESGSIVNGQISIERKAACDRLKKEIDDQLKFYDTELQHLQQRRTNLWDTRTDLQEYLLDQEKSRNASLDSIYQRHSGLLEKIYIRHTDNSEHIASKTIEAGTSSFKAMIMAPINFLLQYFTLSSGISLEKAKLEKKSRDEIEDLETDINDPDSTDINDDMNDDLPDVDEVPKDDDDIDIPKDDPTDEDADLDDESKLIAV